MEIKTDALVLRAADYGENDKIVTLFTADYGKIAASLKGVKKGNAKLKFAAQPFGFAEFVLASRGGRNTVVSASLHEEFYALRERLDRFYAGAAVLGACDKLLFEGMENPRLLLDALTALRSISERENADRPLAVFFLRAMREAGYPVSAGENCPLCGAALKGRIRFDMEAGCFVCPACADEVPASERCLRAIRSALSGEEGEDGDGDRRALRLLRAYFERKTETEPPALAEYLLLTETE